MENIFTFYSLDVRSARDCNIEHCRMKNRGHYHCKLCKACLQGRYLLETHLKANHTDKCTELGLNLGPKKTSSVGKKHGRNTSVSNKEPSSTIKPSDKISVSSVVQREQFRQWTFIQDPGPRGNDRPSRSSQTLMVPKGPMYMPNINSSLEILPILLGQEQVLCELTRLKGAENLQQA